MEGSELKEGKSAEELLCAQELEELDPKTTGGGDNLKKEDSVHDEQAITNTPSPSLEAHATLVGSVEAQIAPLPSNVPQTQPLQEPGAFLHGGFGVSDGPRRLVPPNRSCVTGGASLSGNRPPEMMLVASPSTTNHQTNSNNGGGLLAEAREVSESELPVAVKEDEKTENKRILSSKLIVFLGLAILLLLAGVVILILWCSSVLQDNLVEAKNQNTTAPPLSAEEHLLRFLPKSTLDTVQNDSKSPQFAAYRWLIEDPNLRQYGEDRIRQRFALATLYYATDGNHWIHNRDWMSYEQHECRWEVGESTNLVFQTIATESMCTENATETEAGLWRRRTQKSTTNTTIGDQIVRRLWYQANNMTGTIPDEMYWLTHLKDISLSSNQLQGTLSPTRISKLTNLETLQLRHNRLTGQFPTEIGLLSQLRDLFTGSAGLFEGEFPSEIGLLTNLVRLLMSYAPWTGTLPTELGNLARLRAMGIANTNITGPIPSEYGRLTDVKYLTFFKNQLTGSIPNEIFKFPDLAWVYLMGNKLNGSLPPELGQLTTLQDLRLANNNFQSTIPTEIGLLTRMYNLDLSSNRISGTIPTEMLEQATDLENLELRQNQLTGTLPPQIGRLTKLVSLDLSMNDLSGPLPESSFSNLSVLKEIRLNGNNFGGSLPMEFGLIRDIMVLNVSHNNFVGSVPEEYSVWSNTTVLDLSANEGLEGTIPNAVCARLDPSLLAFDCGNGTNGLCGCSHCPCGE